MEAIIQSLFNRLKVNIPLYLENPKVNEVLALLD